MGFCQVARLGLVNLVIKERKNNSGHDWRLQDSK
jgi:hypothetical protein